LTNLKGLEETLRGSREENELLKRRAARAQKLGQETVQLQFSGVMKGPGGSTAREETWGGEDGVGGKTIVKTAASNSGVGRGHSHRWGRRGERTNQGEEGL